MTKIYLVRHAESEMQLQTDLICGRSDASPLTERGEEQARKLGRWVDKNISSIDIITSSPAVRALDTVRLATLETLFVGQEIVVDPQLHEMSQGEYEGHLRAPTYANAEIQRQIAFLGKDFKLPGGESIRDVGDRMFEWAVKMSQEHGDATILAGTHGLAIRCLAGKIRNNRREDIISAQITNASASIFTFEGDEPKRVILNHQTQW